MRASRRDPLAPAPRPTSRPTSSHSPGRKGVYGGLNLDGTVITASDDWNKAYFGEPVPAPNVLVRGTVHNPKADSLISMLSNGGK